MISKDIFINYITKSIHNVENDVFNFETEIDCCQGQGQIFFIIRHMPINRYRNEQR